MSQTVYNNNQIRTRLIGQGMLGPFILVTTLFALWGFANDVTNPLVKAFKEIFLISNTQSSLVQFAFYFGYFTMAFPAALFIRKYSYKAGILIGLGLYATGALLAIPASLMMNFWIFIFAFYILTFGLAFLETTANPYILSMGPEEMPNTERQAGCKDIASQLIAFPFDVALGGGIERFQGGALGGMRLTPHEDITKNWASRTSGEIVKTAEQLSSVTSEQPVLGLFSKGHMTYMADRISDSTEPTLTEMTQAALTHLNGKPQGYYLMVEGGRIDHGHHSGRAGYALMETQEFANAVAYAVAHTDPKETLILVTADHSHVFTIAGYPTRGNDILGLAKGNDSRGEPTGKPILATDGLPYTTLGYWNGRGAAERPRSYPSVGINATQHAAVPTGTGFGKTAKNSETHGGEDVVLYAKGPSSQNVHGVIEQNKIFDIIVNAFGWGNVKRSTE